VGGALEQRRNRARHLAAETQSAGKAAGKERCAWEKRQLDRSGNQPRQRNTGGRSLV